MRSLGVFAALTGVAAWIIWQLRPARYSTFIDVSYERPYRLLDVRQLLRVGGVTFGTPRGFVSPRSMASMVKNDRLFEAIAGGDHAMVRALLAEDASLALVRATKDRLFDELHWLYVGDTPLHLASAALEPEMVAALLAAGSDVAAVNRRGATPLHYACDPRPNGSVWHPAHQVRVIDMLVAAGAPVSLPDRGGATPLHRAVRARSSAAVRCLLAHGADVRARLKKGGSTPLDLAMTGSGAGGTAGAQEEQQQIIEALLQVTPAGAGCERRGC